MNIIEVYKTLLKICYQEFSNLTSIYITEIMVGTNMRGFQKDRFCTDNIFILNYQITDLG